jgi:hypothetical protein
VPITSTVQLGEIVTISGDALGDSILQFWAVPLVGSILILLVALRLGPDVFRTIVGLMGRTGDPADGVHVTTTDVPGTKMFDLGDKGWIEDYANMETIDWYESTPDDGIDLAREYGIYEPNIFWNKDGTPRLDSESTDV